MYQSSAGVSPNDPSTRRVRASHRDSEDYLQPIIYSTLSVDGIKRLVARHYEVDQCMECILVCRGVSDTYMLSTAQQRFAFKVYRTNWRTRDALLWEMRALQHLDTKGVAVAMPVPRRDGELLTDVHAPEGMRNAVLFRWATGFAPKYSDALHAQQYGQALARAHNAADDLPVDPSRPHLDMAYLFTTPLAGIQPRLRDFPEVATGLAALQERTLARLRLAERQLQDWQFCHGDVWANNARLDGDRLVLFDFDFSGFGWQIFDLATYRWHARCTGLEKVAWEPFIEGYLEIRPGAAHSLEFIGLVMILRHLWTAALFISRSPETGTNFLSDEQLEDLVPFCERIEADDP